MTAAMPLPERDVWTVDDLAGLSDDYRYELVNGRLVVASPIGPHQDLSLALSRRYESLLAMAGAPVAP